MIDEAEIRVLLAKQAITEALHRYCYARDTNDLQLGLSVFHVDATALYEGLFEGRARDFLDHPLPEGSSHHLSNILVEVDGGRATSRSCVESVSPIEALQMLYVIRGRFHDTWSCREGEWRLDHRHFTMDGWHVAPMNHELMPTLMPTEPDPHG